MPAPPLPLSKSPASDGAAVAKPPLRVFICDDDLDLAEEMAAGLTAHGFEVKTRAEVGSPVEALKAFGADVMLLDIFMPPPNGFEIINSLRDDHALKAVPLVLMSGTDTGLLDVAARFCTGHGMRVAASFQKPLRIAEVARICTLAGRSHRAALFDLNRNGDNHDNTDVKIWAGAQGRPGLQCEEH
jgi:DNA-binding response OmpR family regulator